VAFVTPDVHALVDWSFGIETLDKELLPPSPDAVVGRRFADKVVRVRMLSGTDAVLLVHVEIQGRRNAEFAARMYRYWSRIRERYGKPVVSIAVLADDDPDWRPNAHEDVAFSTHLRFEYAVLKLLDLAPRIDELEASDNPFAWLVAVDLRTRQTRPDAERCFVKTRFARALLVNERFSREDRAELYRLLTWVMILPDDLERRFDADVRSLEGVPMEILSPMEVRAMQKARVETRVADVREMTLRVLARRFDVDGARDERARAALAQIADVSVLESLFDIAVTARSRDEFEVALANTRAQ
jgi:hypothetical protein